MPSDVPFSCDTSKIADLDNFALLACQDYNLGNRGDWFGYFRRGIFGFRSRIYGMLLHAGPIHSWRPVPNTRDEIEYQIASFFFNADSALECMTFAINALGNSVAPDQFVDVDSDEALRAVGISNVIGKKPLAGYQNLFSRFQTHWVKNSDLLKLIVDNHDVSKHRQAIYVGGQLELDPPTGFFETLGVAGDPSLETLFSPHRDVLIEAQPRIHHSRRPGVDRKQMKTLRSVSKELVPFFEMTINEAYEDARANIALRIKELPTN